MLYYKCNIDNTNLLEGDKRSCDKQTKVGCFRSSLTPTGKTDEEKEKLILPNEIVFFLH